MSDASFSLRVNGSEFDILLPPNTALLDVLRGGIGLKGTRFGCGMGACGTCTVLIDGHPTQSCSIAVEAVGGREVTTIEAVGEFKEGAAVRQAFLDLQAAQCGYCTNGIIMSLVGLLTRSPEPSRADIQAHLDERHICRCGSHQRICRVIDLLLQGRRDE